MDSPQSEDLKVLEGDFIRFQKCYEELTRNGG